jgi:hypothetical protein
LNINAARGRSRSNAGIEFNSKIGCRVGRLCCERTVSGHTDAEYANPLMKSRRGIVFPQAQGTTPIWTNYSKDLRPTAWGLGVSLHGSKPKLLMSALGHKQTSDWWPLMSALLPKADIRQGERDVRFVPEADMVHAEKTR